MPPAPCAHCGVNFMNPSTDPLAPKLCNNCMIKEDRRTPRMADKEETIDILIKCPKRIQNEIEEECIANGISFGEYFLNLHYLNIRKPPETLSEDEEEAGEALLKDVENILKPQRGRPRKL